jgi:hypothetical protein
MSKENLFEEKVPELKLGGELCNYNIKANVSLIQNPGGSTMSSEQKGSGIEKGGMKANEVIRESSLFNPADEDGLNLKDVIKFSTMQAQKTDGDSRIEDGKAQGRMIFESRDVPLGSEQKGSGIEKGEMKANEVVRVSSLSNPAMESGLKLENTTLSFNHTVETTSEDPETGQSERGLLLKFQMALKKNAGEIDKPTIYSDQNRSTDGVNRIEPHHNLNNNFRGEGEITKHPFKNQPLEGIHLKSEPGPQDIDPMVKRMDVTKIPDTISSAKEMELFQKPLQTIVVKQLVDRAATDLNSGRTAIKINLKPEYLGYLRMEISTENHQVMVKIMTEIPLVKEIIENNINQLKAALAGHGLEMDDLDVFVAHDSDKHEGRNAGTEFTSMENGSAEENIDDILPNEENGAQMAAEISEESLIDFFA